MSFFRLFILVLQRFLGNNPSVCGGDLFEYDAKSLQSTPHNCSSLQFVLYLNARSNHNQLTRTGLIKLFYYFIPGKTPIHKRQKQVSGNSKRFIQDIKNTMQAAKVFLEIKTIGNFKILN